MSTTTAASVSRVNRLRWLAGVLLLALCRAGRGPPRRRGRPGAGTRRPVRPRSGHRLGAARRASPRRPRRAAHRGAAPRGGIPVAVTGDGPDPARIRRRPARGADRAGLGAAGAASRSCSRPPTTWPSRPREALDATLLRSFATQIPQGRALLIQLVLALVVAGVARSAVTSSRAVLATALAAGHARPADAHRSLRVRGSARPGGGQPDGARRLRLAVGRRTAGAGVAGRWPSRAADARSDEHALDPRPHPVLAAGRRVLGRRGRLRVW